MKIAEIDWRPDNIPWSVEFNDTYFSPKDGLAESRHVFCDGIADDVGDGWWQRDQLTIGETGFGSGLNFLTTWQKWRRLAPKDARLHFVSAEAFPMHKLDLLKAHANWPELKDLVDALVDQYPVLHTGFHRLYFDEGRVSLTLLLGDANEMFSQLVGPVDGWYLDGFAPSKNSKMWSDDLFKQLARLSHTHTKLTTFSAPGGVRQGLENAGFKLEEMPGFGSKCSRLSGVFLGEVTPEELPWFAMPAPLRKGASVAIIGAGIAGISCYLALRGAGFNPTIFERSSDLGAGGSGNPVGLIQPRLTTSDSLDGQLNATAYLDCGRQYDYFEKTTGEKLWHGARGGIQLARNEAEEMRFQKLVDEERLPASEMQYLDAGEISKRAGVTVKRPGLYFANAGALCPKFALEVLSRDMDIRFNQDIKKLLSDNEGWQLLDGAGEALGKYDAVILANAHEATRLADIRDVPLTAKRGQVSLLAVSSESENQQCGISFGNYVTPTFNTPAGERYHVVGASYQALEDHERDRPQQMSITDHQENLASVKQISNDYNVVQADGQTQGRAAVRATTVDHLAVLGPVQDGERCEKYYHDLRHGKPANTYPDAPYLRGLYCLTGLGSRGFQTAPLMAMALADLMAGTPNALERRFLNAIHPSRFQIRKLKRKRGR